MSATDVATYRRKCGQFERAARTASAAGDWSAAGLNAVHAAIAASDALTTFHLGERSRSKDHADAATLVGRLALPGVKERSAQLGRILSVKNLVAYEAREITRREAEDLMARMARFVEWALQNVP